MPPEDQLPRPTRFLNFIDRHKVGLTAAGTAIVTATVLTKWRLSNHQEMIEFIEAKGLMSEYIDSHPIIVK